MSFSIPTLREIIRQVRADTERECGAYPLSRSNIRVLGNAFSYAIKGSYDYLDYVAKQMFADTAELENLERHASIQGIYRKQASFAEGTISVTLLENAILPIGTVFVSSDSVRYETLEEPKLKQNAIKAKCMEAGVVGNREAGDVFTLLKPIAGVTSQAIAGAFAGGAEAESDESLRERLLVVLRNPPRGGTATDYVAWAMNVPGVTRAWCFPKERGIGTVNVRFMTDGLTENGIPTPEMVQIVQKRIEEQAPVTASVEVYAPTEKKVNFTIDIVPDTPTIRANIEANLRDLFIRECVPGQKIYLSHVRQAISLAAGETDHKLTAPTEDLLCTTREVFVLGDVTYE